MAKIIKAKIREQQSVMMRRRRHVMTPPRGQIQVSSIESSYDADHGRESISHTERYEMQSDERNDRSDAYRQNDYHTSMDIPSRASTHANRSSIHAHRSTSISSAGQLLSQMDGLIEMTVSRQEIYYDGQDTHAYAEQQHFDGTRWERSQAEGRWMGDRSAQLTQALSRGTRHRK